MCANQAVVAPGARLLGVLVARLCHTLIHQRITRALELS